MTTPVEHTAGAPAYAYPLPPLGADGHPAAPATAEPEQVTRRTVVRRRVPLGTVALGAAGTTGLMVTTAAIMLPPAAALAAGAAAVILPASVLIRRVRRSRRRTAGGWGGSQGNRRRPARSGGLGRSSAGGPAGGARRSSTTRSEGLPSTGKRGRVRNLLDMARGGPKARHTGAGKPAAGAAAPAARSGKPGPAGGGAVKPVAGKGPAAGGKPGAGKPNSSTGGRAAPAKPGAGARPGAGKLPAGSGTTGGAKPPAGGGLPKHGSKPGSGVKKQPSAAGARLPGARRPSRGSTAVGLLDALVNGKRAGGLGPAGGLLDVVRDVARRRQQQRPQQRPPAAAQPPPQHPVSPPRPRTRPAPPPGQHQPTPAPAGHTTNGGTPVSRFFPPRDPAADFYAACVKYTPGHQSGALWNLQWALPGMGEAAWLIANGWRHAANQIAQDLGGGLKPEMAQVLADIYRLYAAAAKLAAGLPAQFNRIHAEDIRRATTRGAHTADVGASR